VKTAPHDAIPTSGDVTNAVHDQQLSVRNLLQEKAELQLALNTLPIGLCMYDSEQRLILCNLQYAKMYNIPPELTRQGTTYRQILERRIRGNVSPDNAVVDMIQFRTLKRGFTRQLNDGRTIAIYHHPIENGGWFSIHEDITERLRAERIAYMAHHDSLTGLANRTVFLEKISEAGARLRRNGETFTALMLDLDRFKYVNDSLGHAAGDELLKEVARRLKSSLRETDIVARLGGDEFAIIQAGARDQREAAIALAIKIIRLCASRFILMAPKWRWPPASVSLLHLAMALSLASF
jgi:diguanylate cyclase (GGDEF)-like protein